MEEEKTELSDKHKLFIAEYIANNCNAFKAYKIVYPDTSDAAARSSSSDLLTNPNIRNEINKKIDEILSNKKDLTLQVLNEYKKIAFSNINKILDPSSGKCNIDENTDTSILESVQIETLKRGEDQEIEKIKYKLYNKQSALDSLSKFMLGLVEKHALTDADGNSLPVNITINGIRSTDKYTRDTSTNISDTT